MCFSPNSYEVHVVICELGIWVVQMFPRSIKRINFVRSLWGEYRPSDINMDGMSKQNEGLMFYVGESRD